MKRQRLNKLAIENLRVADRAVIYDTRSELDKNNTIVNFMFGNLQPCFAVQVFKGQKSSILHNADSIQLYMLPSDARRGIRRINKTIPITSI